MVKNILLFMLHLKKLKSFINHLIFLIMNYSIANLTEVNQCDKLLNWAADEKFELEHKRTNQSYTTERFNAIATQLNAEYQSALITLAGYDTMLGTNLPPFQLADTQDKKRRLEFRIYMLEQRMLGYGTVPLIEKQVDLTRTEVELREVDDLIAQVEERKVFLANQA